MKLYRIYHITSDRRFNYEDYYNAENYEDAFDQFVTERPEMDSERPYLVAIDSDELAYAVGPRVDLF